MSPTVDHLPVEARVPGTIGQIVDMAGVVVDGIPLWLVLSEDGALRRWDPERSGVEVLARLPLTGVEGTVASDGVRRRLHASGCGRFAAVVDSQ